MRVRAATARSAGARQGLLCRNVAMRLLARVVSCSCAQTATKRRHQSRDEDGAWRGPSAITHFVITSRRHRTSSRPNSNAGPRLDSSSLHFLGFLGLSLQQLATMAQVRIPSPAHDTRSFFPWCIIEAARDILTSLRLDHVPNCTTNHA